VSFMVRTGDGWCVGDGRWRQSCGTSKESAIAKERTKVRKPRFYRSRVHDPITSAERPCAAFACALRTATKFNNTTRLHSSHFLSVFPSG
jgi:hypothetical protein